jgi:G3E family GTPase
MTNPQSAAEPSETARQTFSDSNRPIRNPQSKARYIMIGGFLGAGKTTAVAQLAQQLTHDGLRVGLITNDQGSELVDTAMLRSRGFATEEIPGGCFCCRFNSLTDAAQRLTAVSRPDVFIAEPVGSCTDLVATVTYPLRRIYGGAFSIAPLSVLVDPVRALRVFGVESGGKFSEKVLYIYRKQLEEADIIVIGKTDLLDAARREALHATLASEFPHAEIFEASPRRGDGLAPWFDRITHAEQIARTAMDVDYELYADGEALLGWLNCTVQLSAPEAFDADDVLKKLAAGIQRRLQTREVEIAHLKMTLSPDSGLGHIAVINLVRSDFVPELSQTLEDPVESGQLIINLRAEGAPEVLREAVDAAIVSVSADAPGLTMRLDHVEHFRPGKPQPTHRITDLAATE